MTTIRTPSIVVTVNGAAVSDVISARTQHGFNMRTAEAEVVLRAMPAGIKPWDVVIIKMDADVSPATTVRFTGFFISADNRLYPKETTLLCKGSLGKTEIYEKELGTDMSSYAYWLLHGGYYGHLDEVMVSTVLHDCGLSGAWVPNDEDVMPGIGGTGETLGKRSRGRGFNWDKGEAALSFIERLDAVCLGYRTYDMPDGTIVRTQITTIPTYTPDWTFTEAVDIYRATESISVGDLHNRVVVDGYPGDNGKSEISYTAQGGNQYLLTSGVQWFLTQRISSSMIEKELAADAGDGLSCEEVANWQLKEMNLWAEKVVLTTPRDDLIAPGQTVAIVAPTRLGLTRNFWVQEVDCEVDRNGAFSQVLTCISGILPTYALVEPVGVTVTLPAVTATWASELSAAVAPLAVSVTLPAVGASWVYAESAAVAPLAVSVTIPGVTATWASELSAAVAPLAVSVTIPGVTATSSP